MITISINRKKVEIPTFRELTVNQFMELRERINAKTEGEFNLLDYLSMVLEKDLKLMFFSKLKNPEIINKALGKIEDYQKIKSYKFFYKGKNHDLRDYDITLGQRFMIEENAKKKADERLMCFMLAVVLANEMDLKKVNKIYNKILAMPYLDVLPPAFFLANSSVNGKKNAMRYLRKLRNMMKTRSLKNRQA